MSSSVIAGSAILIVEDELLIAMELEQEVQSAGGTVVGPAPTVAAAFLLLAGKAQLDAAILDVNLQGDRSFPIAEALLARGIPFMFLAGQVGSIPSRFDHVTRIEKPATSRGVISTLEFCLS